ncbi:AMMECR1 domain-containing protein [Catenaria anguillulae PL171]|uniref:AMMECR1 domain-containing protein n=1 Tax=Catenaria anguillulae PL171 TaxID=765915 RepID=A0A1Y2HDT8_9FUNG|nr:AMMECR1 domain-containing protein [Catenaria anguillulae PL171]
MQVCKYHPKQLADSDFPVYRPAWSVSLAAAHSLPSLPAHSNCPPTSGASSLTVFANATAFTTHTCIMVASKLHCFYCFDVLSAHLHDADPKSVAAPAFPTARSDSDDSPTSAASTSAATTQAQAAYPLFITWSTTPHLTLRGCIGNFSPLPLPAGLRDYALISATQDHRFAPIRARELPTLHVAVSLLVDFEPCAHPFDWTIGTHGIRISFTCPTTGKSLGATFLPEVAKDQMWDHKRTLVQLVKKAGYVGRWERVSQAVKVVRYQSSKATCSYAEYVAWVEAGRAVEVEQGEAGTEKQDADNEDDEEVLSSA